MSDSSHRHRDPRIPTRFELLYAAGRQEGAGILADISYTGARVEQTQLKPEIGSRLRLYVFLQPVSPLELVGDVVRHTETGFAIRYKVSDPEVRRLVDDAAAIVAAPRR
jgi:hypothetical protein